MTRREMAGCFGAMGVMATFRGVAAEAGSGTGFHLGVCSYSFREFQRKLAISMTKQLGVSYISVKEFHLPYNSSRDEIARAKKEFQKAGLTIASGGNIDLKDEDPAILRRYFEY